jgi:precorrin-6B methylase 2
MKPRTSIIVALLVAAFARLAAQQTALTEGQIKTAAVEVPQLVQLMELKPGMAIADVGAGFGAWTMAFSRWTGPTGRVYSTDVGAAQLASLRESMKRENLTNVTVIEGAVEKEVGAVLTQVRTIAGFSPDSQPASLFLVLVRKAT